MIKENTRYKDSTVFEGMTSIRAVISSALSGVSDRRIGKVLIDSSRIDAKRGEIRYLNAKSKELSFDIEYVSSDDISSLTVGNSHGGIVALCTGRTIPSLTSDNIRDNGFYIMIEGIEDPYNFGYAIRSIYASGADGVVLSPRNWMTASGVVCRSSAGASEMIPIYTSSVDDAPEIFKSRGYKIVAAGIRDSVGAYDADLSRPLFLIVGGEKRGISRALLDKCDEIVRLDYGREFNASLSAASSASILAFEVFRQNK